MRRLVRPAHVRARVPTPIEDPLALSSEAANDTAAADAGDKGAANDNAAAKTEPAKKPDLDELANIARANSQALREKRRVRMSAETISRREQQLAELQRQLRGEIELLQSKPLDWAQRRVGMDHFAQAFVDNPKPTAEDKIAALEQQLQPSTATVIMTALVDIAAIGAAVVLGVYHAIPSEAVAAVLSGLIAARVGAFQKAKANGTSTPPPSGAVVLLMAIGSAVASVAGKKLGA